jgi:hypothetical protein
MHSINVQGLREVQRGLGFSIILRLYKNQKEEIGKQGYESPVRFSNGYTEQMNSLC